MRRQFLSSAAVAVVLAACNPFSSAKTAIIGRWESETWTRNDKPLFAQFEQSGDVSYLGSMYWAENGKWLILDSGELQVTYPSGTSKRCNIEFEGKNLVLTPPTCLNGWNDVGASIRLTKQ